MIWFFSSFALPTFPIESFPLKDKGIHLVEYGGLGFLVAHACVHTFLRRSSWRVAFFALMLTVSWGVLDEIHQAFVPGRSADPLDLLADFVGSGLGVFGRILWTWITPKT
ncbi:MAG: VanZ family protein [Sandaracinaceae bacterium]|nr:VanZ family protein [Sandaracinaceae bacterium]